MDELMDLLKGWDNEFDAKIVKNFYEWLKFFIPGWESEYSGDIYGLWCAYLEGFINGQTKKSTME